MFFINQLLKLCLTLFISSATFQFAHAQSTNNKTILVIGDSLSAEYGIERGKGWVEIIKSEFLGDYDNYEIVNASISGDTTSGGLSRLPALLTRHNPAVVIVELGANDALRGLSLADSTNNLEKMSELSKQAQAKVVIVGMQIPPNFGPVYSQQFKDMFAQVAQKQKALLVPFLFENFALDKSMYQDDGIHPNESAQKTMAENVWSVLEQAIN
ncbi:arylesterase [Advenella sp. WQ 585]|uniref:Arylesterase n=1 Tax=Advenella mandrilli TaxID=2800330 RepID=A0ABS1EDS5_9BURK|nr:arylesterase [Advenella mandrilli]MBK1781160.1 arylesterase [Advenella mandrilli]